VQLESGPTKGTDDEALRFTEDQIIAVLREQEAGMKTADICREHGISDATFYKWKAKCGGLEVSDAKRLRSLEDENGGLKRMLADAMLDNAALKDLLGKSGEARRAMGGGGVYAPGLRDERAAGLSSYRQRPGERALSRRAAG
jgi:putative transposase